MSIGQPRNLEPSAVVGRLLTAGARLAEALDDADQVGGLAALQGKMRPATLRKIVETFRLLRAEIGEQLGPLDRPPRHPGNRRPGPGPGITDTKAR